MAPLPPPESLRVVAAEPSVTGGYALLDSGAGRKLERFGSVVVDRPEPQAMWSQRLPKTKWDKADGLFDGSDEDEQGRWTHRGTTPRDWPMAIGGVTAVCRFSAFRHMGVFPEQALHWQWMAERLSKAPEKPRVLNLFAYTGVSSLIAAKAGAEITHVDASKKSVAWAKENQTASGLEAAPIRWIVDDARKFAAREVRRGKTYHGLVLDPPKFGRGPEGETWELFDHLPELMRDCVELIDPAFGFMIFTAYAIRASALAMDGVMKDVLGPRGGSFESGELAIREAAVPTTTSRLLPTSLYVRWQS
ncbi:MAG: class I SAM-dependent rRNA methyltransferase [Rhodospirillaceae bacterium]|nr:class I SAM-dependent rRNA methyltransferase [Rhodospirillaceae bacterium]